MRFENFEKKLSDRFEREPRRRILWLSQHEPLSVQIKRLQARFGGVNVKVVQDNKTFTDAEDLVQRFNRGQFDDWVMVAPLSVIARVCQLCEELGIPKPLMARMEALRGDKKSEADLKYGGRHYKFISFRRVERLVLEFGEEF